MNGSISKAALLTGLSRTTLVACALFAGRAVAADAEAAASPAVGVEEVIVTAQRREENVQNVGISISALSGQSIQRSGAVLSTDLINSVPNVNVKQSFGPGANANYAIRGVGQTDFLDASESPVAVYIDDVYLVPTSAGSFPLYDLDRVEVLRGPQGTLFGRNSTAGLIHFISRRPEDDFGASVNVGYGSHNDINAGGFINVPLSDSLSARLSANMHHNDGWQRNALRLQPRAGEINTDSVRGQVMYKSGNITNVVKVSYDHAAGHSQAYIKTVQGPTNPVTGNIAQAPPGALDPYGQPTYTSPANDDISKLRHSNSLIAENRLEWDLGWATLTSVTAYNSLDKDLLSDCDGGPLHICAASFPLKSKQFSQEVRAFGDTNGYRWTLGAYYLVHRINAFDIGVIGLPPSAGGIYISTESNFKQNAHSYAVYGNIEKDLSDKITILAGLRLSRDLKTIDQLSGTYTGVPAFSAAGFASFPQVRRPVHSATLSQLAFNVTNFPDLARELVDDWSGKLEINYKPVDGIMLYVSESRGVKAPGFNAGTIGAPPPSAVPFKAERLYATEVGIKSQYFDNRLRINGAAFYYDYKNYQSQALVGLASVTTNVDGRVYGIDAEMVAKPTDKLTVSLSGGLLDTKTFDLKNAAGRVADRHFTRAPPWSLEATVRYEQPVFDGGGNLGFQVSVTAKAAQFDNPGNEDISRIPPYTIANLRVDYTDAAKRYVVSAYLNNFTHERYRISSGTSLFGTGIYQIGRPVWGGVSLTYNFF